MKLPAHKPTNKGCSRIFPPSSHLLPTIPNFPISQSSHHPYKGWGWEDGKFVGEVRLIDLERKVADVVFGKTGGHIVPLIERARRVGTTEVWCYRPFISLCEKLMHYYWQKGGER